jgi:pheromone shutdown-related protein TraB
MIVFKNFFIIGTSHIASHSIKEIRECFNESDPDIIAVELDYNRLHALLSKAKPNYSPSIIREIGLQGYLFALIGGLLQKKLGSIAGIQPGSEMMAAIELAREHKRKVSLIDQELKLTLSNLSKRITLKEKFRFILDLLAAPFSKRMSISLDKVPEKKLISHLLLLLKERYPNFYSVLVEERNVFMVARLKAISLVNPESKIMVVVGAGHAEGMLSLLKD